MSKMTLEQVRDWHRKHAAQIKLLERTFQESDARAQWHTEMADAIDERIKADEGKVQSARERVEMAMREPNAAKAAQVASELGAAHRAISPPAQAAQVVQVVPVGGIRLSAPAWPGQMEGKAPPDGWVTIEADLAPIAKPTLGEFVRMPDAERVAIGQQVASRVDEMTAEPTKLEDAVREVIAYINMEAGVVPGELDKTAPEIIWLQIDTSESNKERDELWPGDDGVTWCSESIGGLEIQYVRADLYTDMAKRLEAAERDAARLAALEQAIAEHGEQCIPKNVRQRADEIMQESGDRRIPEGE